MTQGGADAAAGVREGDILAGKYRVERILGQGGMGVVVAAHHIQLDEKVALKFLLPEALDNAEAVARFAREARAAVKIKSEHVARVSDVGTLPNGAPYMVMEYLEGEDLAAWIKQRGAMPVEQAVEFVLQACVAVADAHALGIVHRDLKPANLFCVRRSDGQLSIKVLDFGISKMIDAAAQSAGSMTRTSALMGSPLYMSPEQMRSSKDVDAQTDIWALGVILFELMTGRPAFLADSITELAIQVTNEPTPSIRGYRPDVPGELEAVVSKCLEKDRRQRFRNVAELALALLPFAPKRATGTVERISGIIQAAGLSTSGLSVPASPQVGGSTVSAGTLPPVGRTTTGVRTGKKAAVGVSLAGAVVLAALFGLVVMLRRSAAQKDDSQAAATRVSGQVETPKAPPPPSVDPPKTAEPSSVEMAPSLARPPPPPPPAPVQPAPPAMGEGGPANTKKKQTPGGFTPHAPSAMGAAPAPAPPTTPPPAAGAKCDPPFYFDAKGNRMFKKECL